MIIKFGGRDWEFEHEATLQQGIVIQSYTGMSINAWEKSLEEIDKPEFLKSLAAVYWLMLAQNGETAPIAEVDFPMRKFIDAYGDALAADLEQRKAAAAVPEPEPGPTIPATPGPRSPEPSTPRDGAAVAEEVAAALSG